MLMASMVILNANTIVLLAPDQNATDGEIKKPISGGSIKYVKIERREYGSIIES